VAKNIVREPRTEVDLDTVLTQLDGSPVMQDPQFAGVEGIGLLLRNAWACGYNFGKQKPNDDNSEDVTRMEQDIALLFSKPFTLRNALLIAASAIMPNENGTIPEKLHIARLAKRVFGATAPVVFNVEDTAQLKNLVNRVFPNALLVEQVLVLLDPSLKE